MKRALITGITGQIGSYLADLLVDMGYEVHGIVRRSSSFSTGRIDHLYADPHDPNARLRLHYGDLTDGSCVRRVLDETRPHEVYNLAAQSHVRVSFDQPVYTADVVAIGALRLFEELRAYCGNEDGPVRVYQASSSEMFGDSQSPQWEGTPFRPLSPYAASKLAAFEYARVYRAAYKMHISNGILFNSESERRGETFVTRKITRAAARIALGLQEKLYLGNIEARRDWQHASDAARAMWLMLQQDGPGDYVIATGESHSVKDFVFLAGERAGIDLASRVVIDPRYMRPAEVWSLRGDSTKMRRLGWKPEVRFESLVQRMVDHDMKLARSECMARQLADAPTEGLL